MRSLRSAPPSPHLKEYVRAYAQRDVALPVSSIAQPVPASLDNVIEFDFLGFPTVEFVDGRPFTGQKITTIGAHTFRRANVRFSCPIDSFGIFFHPFGLWQLFGVPTKELVNNAFAAEDVVGKRVRELWERLAESKSFEHRVKAAERFLSTVLTRASGRTPLMDGARYLVHGPPANRVSELASATGLSLRQYERRFIADVGMSPKLYTRINRYQMALDLKLHRPDRAWLRIAHETGYHDQMHMIRDFKLLSGASPDRLITELGDARPSAETADLIRRCPQKT